MSFDQVRVPEAERYHRDARITEIYGETQEIQKNAVASSWIVKKG